jgi:hypothetical protein
MHPSTARKRQHLLQQMEQIEHMETGALTEEFRSRLIDGVEVSLGPYFKHQQWQAGRNCSRRVPPDEAAPLRAAIEGRQRFEELAEEFVDLTVAATREEASAPQSKKNSRRKSGRRSSRKPPPS